jgi:hexosaminidase
MGVFDAVIGNNVFTMPDNPIALIPQPMRIDRRAGAFPLTQDTLLVADVDAFPEANYLSRQLSHILGADIAIVSTKHGASERQAESQPRRGDLTGAQANALGAAATDRPTIALRIDPLLDHLGDEGYRLDINTTSADLAAPTRAGLFHAVRTLLQLLPPDTFANSQSSTLNFQLSTFNFQLPCLLIEDRPRFRWRGAMLDVSRHFLPPDFVRKFIDLLAMHKMNTLHLHLTDEQGWRIEIKKYPRLTSVGSVRAQTIIGRHDAPPEDHVYDGVPHTGFYTQNEARDLVAYAAARHINIVPEIDIPGHTRAAIAAYPDLGCQGRPAEVRTIWGRGDDILNPSEATFQFLEDVFAELIDIFSSPFIHVGGDEVIKSIWQESPACQERMRELGLVGEDALQAYFIRRMDAFLTAHGRRLVGWDEILQGGLPPARTAGSETSNSLPSREGQGVGPDTPEPLPIMEGAGPGFDSPSRFGRGGEPERAGVGSEAAAGSETFNFQLSTLNSPGAVIMSWNGEVGGIAAAKAGHDAVMAPMSHTYFDFYQSKDKAAEPMALGGFLPLDRVYEYDPIPADLPAEFAHHILGAQAQLWTEYMPSTAQVEYMAFPRLCALAEATWTQADSKTTYEEFRRRLRVHLTRLDALGLNYRPLD